MAAGLGPARSPGQVTRGAWPRYQDRERLRLRVYLAVQTEPIEFSAVFGLHPWFLETRRSPTSEMGVLSLNEVTLGSHPRVGGWCHEHLCPATESPVPGYKAGLKDRVQESFQAGTKVAIGPVARLGGRRNPKLPFTLPRASVPLALDSQPLSYHDRVNLVVFRVLGAAAAKQ